MCRKSVFDPEPVNSIVDLMVWAPQDYCHVNNQDAVEALEVKFP